MPTKDSVVKAARLRKETWEKMSRYMERENITFSEAVRRLADQIPENEGNNGDNVHGSDAKWPRIHV